MSEWKTLDTAPTEPDMDPPLVLLWVVGGGGRGEGCIAFGRCYRSIVDGSVRGVPHGFHGFKCSHWMPIPKGPNGE